jgi:hypothetical protein
VGDDSYFVFRQKLLGDDGNLRKGRCHGEAARSVLSKDQGDVFARFHAVAANLCSKTQNSKFGLLGPVLRATTTTV